MYKLTCDETIIRLTDGASIPPDKHNRDYRAYLHWLEDGNTPEPADPEPVVERVPTVEEQIKALTDTLIAQGVITTQQIDEKLTAEVIKR